MTNHRYLHIWNILEQSSSNDFEEVQYYGNFVKINCTLDSQFQLIVKNRNFIEQNNVSCLVEVFSN